MQQNERILTELPHRGRSASDEYRFVLILAFPVRFPRCDKARANLFFAVKPDGGRADAKRECRCLFECEVVWDLGRGTK